MGAAASVSDSISPLDAAQFNALLRERGAEQVAMRLEGVAGHEALKMDMMALADRDIDDAGRGFLRALFCELTGSAHALAAPQQVAELDTDEYPGYVVELGASVCKAGMVGEEAPQCVIPSKFTPDGKFGDLAAREPDAQDMFAPDGTPVGSLADFFTFIWNEELRDPGTDATLVVVVPAYMPRAVTQMVTQVVFEGLNVAHAVVVPSMAVGMYATGKTSGLTVDVGTHSTRVCPVHDGTLIRSEMRTVPVGGEQIAAAIVQQLVESGHTVELDVARRMLHGQQGLIRVGATREAALDAEGGGLEEAQFELGEGGPLVVLPPRVRQLGPEALFDPSLIGNEAEGLTGVVAAAIRAGDEHRRYLAENIVLMGGASTLQGLSDRLQTELREQGLQYARVLSVEGQRYASWIGASIYGSLSGKLARAVTTKEQYDEKGPTVMLSSFEMD